MNQAVASGTARSLDLKHINSETMIASIEEMISNPQYRRNAQLRSRNFQDQNEHPLQRAMWWIDYVLRNPDISFLKHRNLAAENIFVKHSIDIIAFLTILAIAFLFVAYKSMMCIVNKYRKRPENRQTTDKKTQ